MVILIIAKLLLCSLSRERINHVKGSYQKVEGGKCCNEWTQRFENSRVRINSDWSKDEKRLQTGEAIPWGGEAFEVNKSPPTQTWKQASTRKREMWETSKIRVFQPWYWHFRPDNSLFRGTLLCIVGNLAMYLTFIHQGSVVHPTHPLVVTIKEDSEHCQMSRWEPLP